MRSVRLSANSGHLRPIDVGSSAANPIFGESPSEVFDVLKRVFAGHILVDFDTKSGFLRHVDVTVLDQRPAGMEVVPRRRCSVPVNGGADFFGQYSDFPISVRSQILNLLEMWLHKVWGQLF